MISSNQIKIYQKSFLFWYLIDIFDNDDIRRTDTLMEVIMILISVN